MIELELLGVGADGETLVFTDAEGERYAAPITDELRGATRRDRPRIEAAPDPARQDPPPPRRPRRAPPDAGWRGRSRGSRGFAVEGMPPGRDRLRCRGQGMASQAIGRLAGRKRLGPGIALEDGLGLGRPVGIGIVAVVVFLLCAREGVLTGGVAGGGGVCGLLRARA